VTGTDSLILAKSTAQKEWTGVPDNKVAFTDLLCHIPRLKKKYTRPSAMEMYGGSGNKAPYNFK